MTAVIPRERRCARRPVHLLRLHRKPRRGGVDPSVGSVGDAYDNALAESQIGLYKAELIRPDGTWYGVEHVELEALDWVEWFNNGRQRSHRRLHTRGLTRATI